MRGMAGGSSAEGRDPNQRHHGTGMSSPCQDWTHTARREGGRAGRGKGGGGGEGRSRYTCTIKHHYCSTTYLVHHLQRE